VTLRTWTSEEGAAVLDTVTGPGPVLRALQAVHGAFGYVPDDAVPAIAEHFNVSRADVYGVLTFYSDLRRTPPADVEVRVCMGEACQAVGSRTLLDQVSVSPDCDVQHVYCLGNCALGPTATVNGTILGRADETSLRGAISTAGAGKR
jgi:formate dehydrogenase subunit gamma